MFRDLEKIMYEIQRELLNSETLRKALYYSDRDALTRPAPKYEDVRDLVKVAPIIFVDSETEEDEANSFITIEAIEGDFIIAAGTIALKVGITTDRRIWELDDERIRVYVIAEEVLKLLEGFKSSAAGRLEMAVFKQTYYNKNLIGISLLFDVKVEVGEVDDL